MNKRLKTLLKLAVIICGLYMVIIVCTAKKGLPPIEERVYGVSQIWKKAADHYALWEMADTDPSWDEAYEIAYKEAVEAKNAKEYNELCICDFGEEGFSELLEFAKCAKNNVPSVILSIVDVLPEEDIEECKKIAEDTGVTLRIRELV